MPVHQHQLHHHTILPLVKIISVRLVCHQVRMPLLTPSGTEMAVDPLVPAVPSVTLHGFVSMQLPQTSYYDIEVGICSTQGLIAENVPLRFMWNKYYILVAFIY